MSNLGELLQNVCNFSVVFDQMSYQPRTETLNLSDNFFSGTMPESTFNLPSLGKNMEYGDTPRVGAHCVYDSVSAPRSERVHR